MTIGTVAMQTRASFHPIASEIVKATTRVVETCKIVPNVTPDIPARCVVSVLKKDVRAPAVFVSLSKNVISCLSIARKDLSRARCTSLSEQYANKMPCSPSDSNCTKASMKYIHDQKFACDLSSAD